MTGGAQWIQREVRRQIDSGSVSLDRAELRGLDLAGVDLRRGSLVGADLRDASLKGAVLVQADLSGANLSGADLTGASFQMCGFGGADLSRIEGRRASWRRCELGGASLEASRLRGAQFDGCDLSGANLTGADLAAVSLSGSNLRAAKLSGSNLRWATTVTNDLTDADLRGARRFFMCRDLVAEILGRHAGRDSDRRAQIGMVRAEGKWCFREWRDRLLDRPDHYAIAMEIFELYPESGCAEALASGWVYRGGSPVDLEGDAESD